MLFKKKSSPSMPQQHDERDRQIIWWMKVAITFGLLEAALIAVYGFHRGYPAGLNLFSQAVLLAGATQVAGALLGFLFGIPRHSEPRAPSTPGPKVPAGSSSQLDYQPNTNLEQISDWLTKILVGVSLTQLPAIRDTVREFVEFAAVGLGGADTKLLAFVILAYSLTCGFLLGYLATRLFLPGAFVWADIIARRATEEIQQTRHEVSIGLRQAVAISEAVVALRPDASSEDRSFAIKRLHRVTDELPRERTAAILLGRLYRREGDWPKAIERLSHFLDAKEQEEDPDPDYNEDRAAALYNRACYYAQIFATAHANEDAENALRDLGESVKIFPGNKAVASSDRDFDPLRHDAGLEPRFQALLV